MRGFFISILGFFVNMNFNLQGIVVKKHFIFSAARSLSILTQLNGFN